jgi:hypothetical protein
VAEGSGPAGYVATEDGANSLPALSAKPRHDAKSLAERSITTRWLQQRCAKEGAAQRSEQKAALLHACGAASMSSMLHLYTLPDTLQFQHAFRCIVILCKARIASLAKCHDSLGDIWSMSCERIRAHRVLMSTLLAELYRPLHCAACRGKAALAARPCQILARGSSDCDAIGEGRRHELCGLHRCRSGTGREQKQ